MVRGSVRVRVRVRVRVWFRGRVKALRARKRNVQLIQPLG